MTKRKVQKREAIKLVAFKNRISDLELSAIIKNEKKHNKKMTPETKVTEIEMNNLYKKYFGVSMKDRI